VKRSSRLLKILRVFGKYRLDELLPDAHLPWPGKFLLKTHPWRLIRAPELSRGERIRCALEELGPIFVKFGQLLSTRRDLLPDDIADELQKLQDQVPPFPSDTATKIIETALKGSVDDLFAQFDKEPLASASVAQVHTATLHSGENVVVKVIRPGVEKIIQQDIALLYTMAGWLEKYWVEGKRLRPVEVVSDYDKTIHDELDLLKEAANASTLRRNFENSPKLFVPSIYWDYCRQDVLVMERIHGIPVADIAALKQQNTNLKLLAERGVEVFFTQVFRDSFFHADMHPGNVFVSTEHPENPQYIAVDFGIIGTLTPEDQSYLARNLLAFFNRDYRRIAELHIESGWVPDTTRVNEFESAIRSVCEPIFDKPIKDISFGTLLLRLFQTARRFNMEVQPQLVLLQKTLLNIEGLGRQIYPDLDLWSTAHPFLEKWMIEKMGPRGVLKSIRERAPDWLEQLPNLPQLAVDAMQQVKHLDQIAKNQQQAIDQLNTQLEERGQNQGWRTLGWLTLIAGLMWPFQDMITTEIQWSSGLAAAAGLLLLIRYR